MTHVAQTAVVLFKSAILALAVLGLVSTLLAMSHHFTYAPDVERTPLGVEASDTNAT